MTLSLWFWIFVLSPSASAGEAQVQSALASKVKAQDDYYRAVRNLQRAPLDQLQSLKNSILDPADQGLAQAIQDRETQEIHQLLEEEEAKRRSTLQRIEQVMQQEGQTEEQRVKGKQAMTNAMKGDFTGLNLDKAQPSPSPSPQKEFQIIPVQAPEREGVILDGSHIPREVEFSGKKSQLKSLPKGASGQP